LAGTGSSERDGFRPDIEGLRGVAVLLVVLFHASLFGVAGGFIGVDVFFVISGFLITGLLLRERERTGRVGMLGFYARRARRILPAALVVIAIVLPISYLILDPLSRQSVIFDAVASTLSFGNIRFAAAAGDYFATVGTPSPFLHFWSLGVEEQFYLVWPALLILVSRGPRSRLGIGLLLVFIIVASFAANLIVTDAAVNWAFYSLPTRAWQLALGGLLAVVAPSLARLSSGQVASGRKSGIGSFAPIFLAILGWGGVAAIAWSAFAFGDGLAYPGAYALVPTLGAAAVLIAGGYAVRTTLISRLGPGFALGLPPIRFLGRISYSLYLWHWPLLVLVPIALGHQMRGVERVGVVGAAIVLATISCLLVEEPLRRHRGLARRPVRTLAIAFAAVLTLVAASGAMAVDNRYQIDDPAIAGTNPGAVSSDGLNGPGQPIPSEDIGQPTADPNATDAPVVVLPDSAGGPGASATPGSTGAPGATTGPGPTETSRPMGDPGPDMTFPPDPSPAPVSGYALPANVQPALSKAHDDKEVLWNDLCLAYERVVKPPNCVYGDPNGTFTIALVGDSHAAHMFPAFQRVALLHRWRLLVFAKVSCPFDDMRIWANHLKREYTECATWNDNVVAKLAKAQPDLTVFSQSLWVYPAVKSESNKAAEAAAFAREIAMVPGRRVILVDAPNAAQDAPDCLASHRADIRPCATPRSIAYAGHGVIDHAAANIDNLATIDLASSICVSPIGAPCPDVVNGMIVFRDYHHLTATFAASLAPDLNASIEAVIQVGR
jgi:peptidoglycan/LPS O-acetylase OafA/YrhL